MNDKQRRYTRMLLSVIALVLIAQGGWIQAKAWLAQQLLAHAWEQTLADGQAHKPWPWADHWPVARLQAPEHGQSLIVLAGDSGAVLAFAPGHNNQSGLPESESSHSTSVISGHRDTHFRFLKAVQREQELILETPSGEFHYRIDELNVVDANTQKIAIHPNDNRLLLITCWPFDARAGEGSQRYAVTASRVL